MIIPELDLFSLSCRRPRQWRTGNLVNLRGIVAASGPSAFSVLSRVIIFNSSMWGRLVMERKVAELSNVLRHGDGEQWCI